jgi:hypothetical protein
MIKNYRDIIVLLITVGVLILLAVIIVGDYWVALEKIDQLMNLSSHS